MKGKKVFKTLLAAVMCIAIAVVFVPVFGQVDKASAKTDFTIEIVPQEWHQLPLDEDVLASPDFYLESREYKDGQGDVLRVTFGGGEPVDYYCTEDQWTFESQDGESIMLALSDWVNPPTESDPYVVGQSYDLTAFVWSATAGTGISGNPYIQNLSVKIVEPIKKVEDIKLTVKNSLQLCASASGLYNCDDVTCSKGDELAVKYDDGSIDTFTADEDGDFFNQNNEKAPLYFKWKKDDGVALSDDGELYGEVGKTYRLYYFTYAVMENHVTGTEVYGYDYDADDWDTISVTIADHTFGANEITKATPTADGLITRTCTVCGTKETETIAKASGYKLSATSYTYNGKAKKPAVTVTDADGKVIAAENYDVAYSGNVNAGTKAAVKVTFKGDRFSGSKTLNFTIKKAAQSITKITPKSKTYKAAKKTKKLAKTYKFTLKAKSKGAVKVKFSKANKAGGSKITVSKAGKVSVKKGLKKGTYKVKVKATKAANANYNAAKAKTVTVKIVVK